MELKINIKAFTDGLQSLKDTITGVKDLNTAAAKPLVDSTKALREGAKEATNELRSAWRVLGQAPQQEVNNRLNAIRASLESVRGSALSTAQDIKKAEQAAIGAAAKVLKTDRTTAAKEVLPQSQSAGAALEGLSSAGNLGAVVSQAVQALKAGDLPGVFAAIASASAAATTAVRAFFVAFISNPIGLAVVAIAALGVALVGLVGKAGEAQDKFVEQADALDKLSSQTGIAADKLQVYGAIAKVANTDVQAVGKGIGFLQKQLANDTEQGKDNWLKRLGVESKDTDAALIETAQKIEALGSDAEKTAARIGVFGKAGQELSEFLSKIAASGEGVLEFYKNIARTQDAQSLATAAQVDAIKDLQGLIEQGKDNQLAAATIESRKEAELASAAYSTLSKELGGWRGISAEASNAWNKFQVFVTEGMVSIKGFWRDTTDFVAGAWTVTINKVAQVWYEFTGLFFRGMALVKRAIGQTTAADEFTALADQAAANSAAASKSITAGGDRVAAALSGAARKALNAKFEAARSAINADTKGGAKPSGEGALAAKSTKDTKEKDTLSAKLALERALLEGEFAKLDASIKNNNAIIDQAYKDGLVSIDEVYQARAETLKQRNAAERLLLTSEAAATEKAIKDARSKGDEAKALGFEAKLATINVKLATNEANLSEESRKLGFWKIEQEKELSSIRASIAVDYAALTGNFDADAFKAQVEEKFKGKRVKLEAELVQAQSNGDTQTAAALSVDLQRYKVLQDSATAQAQFNSAYDQYTRLRQTQDNQITDIQRKQQQGLIGELEAQAQILAARQAQLPVLQQQLAAQQALLDNYAADDAIGRSGAEQRIRGIQTAIEETTPVVVSFGQQVSNAFQNTIGTALNAVLSGTKSMKDAFKDMLKNVLQQILQSNIQKSLAGLFGGVGGAGGGLLGGLGSLFGFSSGGYTGNAHPSAAAGVVHGQEYVLNAQATKSIAGQYGMGLLDALNRNGAKALAGYRAGGLVALQSASNGIKQTTRTLAGYAAGGLVATAAAAAPMVNVQIVNNGTPQRVTEQGFDLEAQVLRIVTADVGRGGMIDRAIQSSTQRRR